MEFDQTNPWGCWNPYNFSTPFEALCTHHIKEVDGNSVRRSLWCTQIFWKGTALSLSNWFVHHPIELSSLIGRLNGVVCIYTSIWLPRRQFTAKFHELPILLIFGPGLQIMIYLIILASKARHANLIDTTGGRGLRSIILVCLALEAKIIKYIMIWSPGPNISTPSDCKPQH